MKKLILFDFDGTVANSMPAILNTINICLEEYGNEKIEPESIVIKIRSDEIKRIFKKSGIAWYKIPFFIKLYWQEYERELPNLKPVAELPEIIYNLKKLGYKLGLITSNSNSNIFAFLKNNNLEVFDFISANVKLFGKFRGIKKLLKENNIKPQETVYIGDETRDIEAAKKNQIPIIAVTWGLQSKESLEKFYPDYLITHPEQLLDIINNL